MASKVLDGLEDIKLQLNNHSRAMSTLTTEVRKAVELMPPLHPVVPLDDAQAVLNAPSFNLPLRELHELPTLNMQLSDKSNVTAFVSFFVANQCCYPLELVSRSLITLHITSCYVNYCNYRLNLWVHQRWGLSDMRQDV